MTRYAAVMSREGLPMGLALLCYLLAFLYLRPDQHPVPQECENIARHLAAGEGFSLSWFSPTVQPSANQEPVYPLLMALFFRWVPAPYTSLLGLQVGIWLWAAWTLGNLAHRLLGVPRPLVSLAAALWPPLAIYTLSFHPLWLRATALVLVLALAARYRDRPTWQRALALGAGLGGAALVRSPFLVLPALVVPWAMLGPPRGQAEGPAPRFAARLRSRRNHLLIAAVAMTMVLSPWVIRNRVVLGSWLPGTTTAGYTALLGNHPGASGAMDVEALRPTQQYGAEFWQLSELERDAVFRRQVLAYWREYPAEAAGLYLKKVAYLWTWWPRVGVNYPSTWTWAYLALWSVALPLILVGWRLARRRQAAAPDLFLGLWGCYSLLYALFAVNMRFRFELEALLLPYALLGAGGIGTWLKRRLGRADSSAPGGP